MRTDSTSRLLAAVACLILATPGGFCADAGEFDPDLPDVVDTDARDRAGLKRDTLYFAGYQWVTIGILYISPESVSGWSEEQKEGYDMSHWWDNVTHPEMDSDDFYINYVLHPYWGAAYFVRARERGYNDREAFWYSVLLSSMYELGAEALFEEPSIQDLIVTPVFGSLLGRYFMRVRGDIREREYELGFRTRKDKWLWALTDPLGSLNDLVDRMVGRETELRIQPYRHSLHDPFARPVGPTLDDGDLVSGLQVTIQW